MAELDLKYTFNKGKNKLMLYEHRIITTSLYYNVFIQETILEFGNNEIINLLSRAATDSTLTLSTMYFNEHMEIKDKKEKLKTIALLYKGLGYGIIDLNNIDEKGGIAIVVQSNVVEMLKTKFNKNDEPCYYTNGFILGGISSVYQKGSEYYKITDIFDFNDFGYKVKVEVA
jgi:hypothetical protein